MTQYNRTDRISAVLQRELADLLRREIRDPRLTSMISITAVEISRDLSHAKIYITQLESNPEAIKTTLKILNHAVPYLRTQIGNRIKLRIIPQLRFIYDESISHGAHLIDLINKATASHSSEEDKPEDPSSLPDPTPRKGIGGEGVSTPSLPSPTCGRGVGGEGVSTPSLPSPTCGRGVGGEGVSDSPNVDKKNE
jgi:ribosome-binding factor A